MLAWQTYCAVPVKSFQLELLAANFISNSGWRLYDFFWFDWITRDFFAHLYHRANTSIVVPGTLETIHLGNDWQSRAETAYWRTEKACDHEKYNRVDAAGEEWQKIFGSQIPRTRTPGRNGAGGSTRPVALIPGLGFCSISWLTTPLHPCAGWHSMAPQG